MTTRVASEANAEWRVPLADVAATEALATWLAGWVKPGEAIALKGELGAGKTTFARAFLRAALGDPSIEAPSPTFTLMQIYEGDVAPIVHADFYRIRGPAELVNLGWEEAIDGAITLVEWPERAIGALPPDQIEVELAYDPSAKGARIATLRGKGELGRRIDRERAILALLDRAGWTAAERRPLHGDASTRAYARLKKRTGETAILMISPPRVEGPTIRYGKSYAQIARLSSDIRAFLAMDVGLAGLGYSTPRIYAASVKDGLALLEDFGSETIVDADGAIAARYTEAAALLAHLHNRDLPDAVAYLGETHAIPPYDVEAMLIEVELVLDWYAPAIARVMPSSGSRVQFLALWRDVLEKALQGPRTWTLRDFHSPNLHWLADREGLARVGVIDFQDAVLGPPAYDVASLLQDARVDVGNDLELRLLAYYSRRRSLLTPSFDQADFLGSYAIMGAQRATKILGGFARLDKRDGKPQYVRHLPRLERTLAKNLAHPKLSGVRAWFETNLPRALGIQAPA